MLRILSLLTDLNLSRKYMMIVKLIDYNESYVTVVPENSELEVTLPIEDTEIWVNGVNLMEITEYEESLCPLDRMFTVRHESHKLFILEEVK